MLDDGRDGPLAFNRALGLVGREPTQSGPQALATFVERTVHTDILASVPSVSPLRVLRLLRDLPVNERIR